MYKEHLKNPSDTKDETALRTPPHEKMVMIAPTQSKSPKEIYDSLPKHLSNLHT